MIGRRFLEAAVAAFLLTFPVATVAQPQATEEQQALLTEAGVVFPDRIAGFTRVRISSVQPGRVGATYAGPGDALADIFLARSTRPVTEEFDSTEGMIGTIFANLRPVRDLPAPAEAPGALGRIWSGETNGRPVYTAMMLWQRRGWRIKARVTLDASMGDSGLAEIERFIREFNWEGASSQRHLGTTDVSAAAGSKLDFGLHINPA